MPSSCHAETASSSSSTLLGSELSMEPGLDKRIKRLLASYKLSARRNQEPQESDKEELKRLHSRLFTLIHEECNARRRRNLLALLATSNCFREQLLFLRRYQNSRDTSPSGYFSVMHSELSYFMKQSFEEEYRKLADFLGFLETLAEVLVSDVNSFGMRCSHKNITVRKLIANALTNLTFGDLQRKRRLCSYPNFIEYVVKVIDEMQELAQVYAALLRNLSWNADLEMNKQLCLTVPVLAQSSLRAYGLKDTKCLCSTLSALWNLSFSIQNQRAVCVYPQFLEMLVNLLLDRTQETQLLESASGVLKYASLSFAMVNVRNHLAAMVLHKMMFGLVDLLRSSSFTVVTNCLCVLSELLKSDYQLRVQLKLNPKAVQILHCLRDSKHEEVSIAIKAILDQLSEADVTCISAGFYARYSAPASSGFQPRGIFPYSGAGVPAPSFFDASLAKIRSMSDMSNPCAGVSDTKSSRIFNYQAPLSVPSAPYGFAPPPGAMLSPQFNSLPRQCYQSVGTIDKDVPGPSWFGQQVDVDSSGNTSSKDDWRPDGIEASDSHRTLFLSEKSCDIDFDLCSPGGDEDPSFEIEESVRCTRGSSTQSLTSLDEKSGWNSCNNSAVNSNRLSPVSLSELPQSPTQCATLRNKEHLSEEALELNTQSARADFDTDSIGSPSDDTEEIHKVCRLENLRLSDRHGDSSACTSGTAKADENAHSPQSSANEEDDYGSFSGVVGSEFLNQSIEAAMPKRLEVSDEFLSDMIEQAQPKPSLMLKKPYSEVRNYSSASTTRMHSDSSSMQAEEDDFLQQSIDSVLPQSSPSHRTILPGNTLYEKRIF